MITKHTNLHDETIACLQLARSKHIGPAMFVRLIQRFGSALNASEHLPKYLERQKVQRPIHIFPRELAIKEAQACTQFGATLLGYTHTHYPPALKAIPYPPSVLTVLGNEAILHQSSIAMVGSRHASAGGCRFAKQLAHELSHQFTVVSGLAKGIDTAAHSGALKAGTIAVTACGIDQIYPLQNTELYWSITKHHGAIITEMPFGTKPLARNFPKRNRIIAGLSLATIVIEAQLKSGSLITANYALEQHKDVFAVPGSPIDPRCQGTNQLIKDGAYLLESVNDVYQILDQNNPIEHSMQPLGAKDTASQTNEQHNDNVQSTVIKLLGAHPVDIDQIIELSGFPASDVLNVMLELELIGRIERYPGNKVTLVT